MTGTIKCPICGRPYKWYSHTVLDQSACPSCVAEAERGARTAADTRACDSVNAIAALRKNDAAQIAGKAK